MQVVRHPVLQDVVVLPSAPMCPALNSPCTEKKNDGGTAVEHGEAEVVLDRLCGEAVLRGSDAFAKGGCLTSNRNTLAVPDFTCMN